MTPRDKISEAVSQYSDGLITALEFRNKIVLALCEVEDEEFLGSIATVLATLR